MMQVSDELETGRRLGPYRLLTKLGHGGMATVWAALEQSPQSGKQRVVAVKAMLPELAEHPEFRSMFLAEGQIVRSIQHPHVVRVYDVGEDAGILFMAMEWVEGDALHTLIHEARKRRAVPPEMAVRILADVAGGLHEAHELRGWDGELRGLVHSDVSPHNVLIGVDGRAKLVDFGVARAVAMSDVAPGTFMGKYAYLSPEQAMGFRLDRRSDLFSLGIVLFELTTGERLFRGRDAAHSLQLVCSGAIPRPSDIHPKYPKALERIVLRALNRDADRRYQTAEDLRLALEGYLIDQRIVVSPAGVGSLLRRIMGGRIHERRQQMERAVRRLAEEPGPSSIVPRSVAPRSVAPRLVAPRSVRLKASERGVALPASNAWGAGASTLTATGSVDSAPDTISVRNASPLQLGAPPSSGSLGSTTHGPDFYFTDASAALPIEPDLELSAFGRPPVRPRSRALWLGVPLAALVLLAAAVVVRGHATLSASAASAVSEGPAVSIATGCRLPNAASALAAKGAGACPAGSGSALALDAPEAGSGGALALPAGRRFTGALGSAIVKSALPASLSLSPSPSSAGGPGGKAAHDRSPAVPAKRRRDPSDLGISNPYR